MLCWLTQRTSIFSTPPSLPHSTQLNLLSQHINTTVRYINIPLHSTISPLMGVANTLDITCHITIWAQTNGLDTTTLSLRKNLRLSLPINRLLSSLKRLYPSHIVYNRSPYTQSHNKINRSNGNHSHQPVSLNKRSSNSHHPWPIFHHSTTTPNTTPWPIKQLTS